MSVFRIFCIEDAARKGMHGLYRRKWTKNIHTHRDLDALWVVEVDSLLRESKFYGQATKGARWMPWQKQAMKDVASCDKLRGAAHRR